MNEICIAGIAVSTPARLDSDGQDPHIRFQLLVSHKDNQGRMRHELYTVNAWKRLAEWAWLNIASEKSVTVIVYLTQHNVAGCPLVEITASRFFIDREELESTRKKPVSSRPPLKERR